ncbi:MULTISPECIES: NAD(P)H-binding protein [Streptomyces]|uniref:NAD(P)H-binding protein n=1 Tax=Streptomyces TaxID=1883 RepID=UPI0033D052B5
MHRILVVGGTGKTGRRVVLRLEHMGWPVRAASPSNVSFPMDLADRTTWAPALRDISAVYLMVPSTQAHLATQGILGEFLSTAASAGVRRVVLLSGIGVRVADEDFPLKIAERELRAAGVEWTVLRPTWFSQNFSESYWLSDVLAGALRLPVGKGEVSFIDAEDIADVAVAALTQQGHAGQVYDLTGPRAIGFAEVGDLIGRATGRTIRYVETHQQAYTERLLNEGLPARVANARTVLHVAIGEGRDGSGAVADGVVRALGRPPRAFEDYVSATAATGCWNGKRP